MIGCPEPRRKMILSRDSRSVGLAVLLFLIIPQAGPPAQEKYLKPEIQRTPEGIAYLSAGIGYDSRINLPRFSLKLVFVTKSQKYLADIDTEISADAPGKPIRIKSRGPWLYVDLPPGNYRIRARTTKGEEVKRSFTVRKNTITRVQLTWDISDEEI